MLVRQTDRTTEMALRRRQLHKATCWASGVVPSAASFLTKCNLGICAESQEAARGHTAHELLDCVHTSSSACVSCTATAAMSVVSRQPAHIACKAGGSRL